jgi:putative transposase
VSAWAGTVYVAFVMDASARRMLAWRVANSMPTELILHALERAIWTRARESRTDLHGLISPSDVGSHYTPIAFSEHLAEAGVDASVGSVGDAYHNPLAETVIGLYQTELIRRRGPWRNAEHVEAETPGLDPGCTGFKHRTTDGAQRRPATDRLEQAHYRHNPGLAEAG